MFVVLVRDFGLYVVCVLSCEYISRLVSITANGERVTHLYPNDCYYAHLSIYRFAMQFCRDGIVLDAGCGAGYGAAYLANHGAKFVHGIDISTSAIAFNRFHFRRSNLKYAKMDVQAISNLKLDHFDLIVSSNTLEHIPDVPAFFRKACRLLKPDGILLIAVPPVAGKVEREANLKNPHHLNIWTPRQCPCM